jgi:hypothetical protein
MDTRFWGPSGWRLLHMIAESPFANRSRIFWEMLPFVLPCKFCRASLSGYYELLPIPRKQEDFSEWLYKIHNLVNQKLRDQGQSLPPDPPYSAVKQHYTELLEIGCTKTEFPGWNFLFCITDNHPDTSPSKPMPDAPQSSQSQPISLIERNKYNLLTSKERKVALKKFWQHVSLVLPFEEWQDSWKAHAGPLTKVVINRRSALQWLWKIKCGMESDLKQISSVSFHGLCKKIATHRSGCSTSTRAKTCRKTQNGSGQRKTRRNNQR